ncbi:helix-turn-helix domain-containing protein [Paraburkholderia sp. BCC1885]|uniref:helix-turn-helix domain-containing protein n=1 Tax=Paraburkholderia sp. BCC1885 TaxID=2562669 RepID=UPI0011829ABC|nr:helix-turn-helix domain-containing protein [Paraburkholderia sp. BCC1885]
MDAELKTAVRAVQIYAERHPRPPHVTMTQAAQMLDLSRATVRKLVNTGKLRMNGCGLIPIEQVDALLTADYA